MQQGSIDNFNYSVIEDGTRSTDTGVVLPLYTVELTNTDLDQTVLIKQMVCFLPHTNYVLNTWNTVVSVLNGEPHCCFAGKVFWLKK
jgi:hypothetical protein